MASQPPIDPSPVQALDELRSTAADIGDLSQRLWTRMMGGDVPWDAGNDIGAEFCGELRDIEKRLIANHKALTETANG